MRIALSLASILLVLGPALAAAQDKEPEIPQPTPKQVEPGTPPGTPIPGPNAAQAPYDLPRDRMSDSLKDLYNGNAKEAGKKVKAVIAAMQSAADTSRGESIKANLLRSVVELESKSELLRSGGTVSGDEMTAIFSRALQALAEHHAAMASAHFQSKATVGAGQDLRAAVLDVNQAVVWGNLKLSTDESNRLNTAARTAKSLIEQKSVDKGDTAKVMADLQQWVGTLRNRLPKSGT
jgi:hypothetical protein